MTTIEIVFKGKHSDLEMLLNTGIRDYSTKILAINSLTVSWIFEESDRDKAIQECMELVDMRKVELWNIDISTIS